MLQVVTGHRFQDIDALLRRAAERRQASVQPAVHHVGHLLHDTGAAPDEDAMVFTLCHHELFAALLAADIRVSAFIPIRVAAYTRGGKTVLETMSPVEMARLLNRPDLAPLAVPLEELLSRIMEEAAGAQVAVQMPAAHRGGLGATEEQVNLRASLPQRVDQRGTKIEDLGGTGRHDSQGG